FAERIRRERASTEATATLDKAQAEDVRTQLQLGQLHERFAAARQRATEVGDKVAELRRRFTSASQQLRIVQGKRALTALQDRLNRANDLDSQISNLSTQLHEAAPNGATLAKAERLFAESRAKREIVPSLALRVRIDGTPDLRVFVDGALVATSEALALEEIR